MQISITMENSEMKQTTPSWVRFFKIPDFVYQISLKWNYKFYRSKEGKSHYNEYERNLE